MNMEPTSSAGGAAVGLGIKSGLFVGLAAAAVSFLAVVIGFTIVPLTAGRETLDATRRFAAGLLCSFTLGPLLAIRVIDWWPGYMRPWQRILTGEPDLFVYFAAAVPFIAVSALLGFWLVAGLMRYFTRRAGKDIGELARDAAADVHAVIAPRDTP